jgi:hypothetical protein
MGNGGAEERGGGDWGGRPRLAGFRGEGPVVAGRGRRRQRGGCRCGDCVWAGGGYSSPILLSFHNFLFSVCFPTVFFFLFVPVRP